MNEVSSRQNTEISKRSEAIRGIGCEAACTKSRANVKFSTKSAAHLGKERHVTSNPDWDPVPD